MRKFTLLLALMLIGCGVDPGKTREPVEITGRVTVTGKPVSDVTFNLQPTGAGTQAMFYVKRGEFRGKVTPGRYTYYISEGAKLVSMRSIPEKYRSGSMERQIDISATTPLAIALD